MGKMRREVFVGLRWVRSGSPEVVQMDSKWRGLGEPRLERALMLRRGYERVGYGALA